MKSFLIAAAALSALFLSGGCEVLESSAKEKPSYVITINEIVKYPRTKKLEQEIETFSGGKIWININHFLHSSAITDIELVPSAQKQEFYDLKLFLDRRGHLMWTTLSGHFTHTELAFVIDGVYYRSIIPDRIASEEDPFVIVKGPFDPVTAKALQSHAKKNYKHFNGGDDALSEALNH